LDAFGHPVLAGAAEKIKDLVQEKLNTKTRTVLLGYAQRAAEHFASSTDSNNAFACGEAAVRAAIQGNSGYMVKIVRSINLDSSIAWYRFTTVEDIANVEHFVPANGSRRTAYLPDERFVNTPA
jgi:6-phosphofructokinase 1